MSNGTQQDIWWATFCQKPIRELKTVGPLRGSRDDENGNFGLQLLHLFGNLGTGLAAEKVIGDHQLNGILPEKLQAFFARASRKHVVAFAAKQEWWLYMSAFFEKNRRRYMDSMLSVSTEGAWEVWIRFCLEGVISQALDAEKRCDNLLTLHRDFHERLKEGSVRLSKLVDRLFSSSVINVNQYKRVFGVSYPTARSDLKKLEAAGIVTQLESMDQISYYCVPIYRATFEDIDIQEG